MKFFKRLLLFIVIILVIILLYLFANGFILYKEAMQEKSLEDRIASLKEMEHYTTYSELPDFYVDAVVAIEDHRFFNHHGVDFIATLRAFRNNLVSRDLKEGRKFYFATSCKEFMFYTRKNNLQKNCRTFCGK